MVGHSKIGILLLGADLLVAKEGNQRGSRVKGRKGKPVANPQDLLYS